MLWIFFVHRHSAACKATWKSEEEVGAPTPPQDKAALLAGFASRAPLLRTLLPPVSAWLTSSAPSSLSPLQWDPSGPPYNMAASLLPPWLQYLPFPVLFVLLPIATVSHSASSAAWALSLKLTTHYPCPPPAHPPTTAGWAPEGRLLSVFCPPTVPGA